MTKNTPKAVFLEEITNQCRRDGHDRPPSPGPGRFPCAPHDPFALDFNRLLDMIRQIIL